MKQDWHFVVLGFSLVVAATLFRAALRGWFNVQGV